MESVLHTHSEKLKEFKQRCSQVESKLQNIEKSSLIPIDDIKILVANQTSENYWKINEYIAALRIEQKKLYELWSDIEALNDFLFGGIPGMETDELFEKVDDLKYTYYKIEDIVTKCLSDCKRTCFSSNKVRANKRSIRYFCLLLLFLLVAIGIVFLMLVILITDDSPSSLVWVHHSQFAPF